MTKLRSVLRRWTGKFPPSKNERPEEFGSLKAHLPTVCNPTSITSDPALPVHITSHLIESMGSSKTSSTSCPRLDSPEIEDKAGPLLRRDPSGSAVSGDRNAGH